MPVKSKKQPTMVGLSTRQMRRKPIGTEHLLDIKPLTPSQEKVFDAWQNNKHMFLFGAAGTGKSFVTMYLALRDILDEKTPYNKLYIVRSLVPTREIGFLPGDHEDKANLYQIPYKNMVRFMFEMPDDPSFEMLYANLKAQDTVSFWSTSFIRGTSIDNSIVLVDESENLNFHELDSIITRLGVNSKLSLQEMLHRLTYRKHMRKLVSWTLRKLLMTWMNSRVLNLVLMTSLDLV